MLLLIKNVLIAAATLVVGINASAAERDGLRPDQMANLTLVRMQANATQLQPNQMASVEVTIRNNNTHDERGVPLVFFAGPERVQAMTLDLAAGETRSVPFNWRASIGVHTLTARLDPDGALPTIDRSDDSAFVSIAAVALSGIGADFAIGPIIVEQDRESGARTARVNVRNNGTAAGSAPVEILIDGKPESVEIVRLEPGASVTLTTTLPDQATSVRARVNQSGSARARSAADNDVIYDLRVQTDVRVDRLSMAQIGSNTRRTQHALVSFRVLNLGKQDIRDPFTVSIQRSAGQVGRAAADRVQIPALPSGRSVFVSHSIELGGDDQEIMVKADLPSGFAPRRPDNITLHRGSIAPVGQWTSIGPTLISNGGLGAVGRLSAIAIHRSDPATIYVGAAAAGVWKTRDGGATWQPIADSLPTLAIAALAIAPAQPSTVYVATSGSGVYRSDDAGSSWQALPASPNGEVRWGVLIVSPRDPATVFMNTSNGVYRSTDSGVNWTRVFATGRVTDLVMAQGSPTTLFAAVAGDGIYRTINGGANWVRTSSGLPALATGMQITLAASRSAPDTLYAGVSASGGLQLFRTDDSGASWIRKNTPDDTTLYNDAVGVGAADPNVVYVTGVNLWRSTNGGGTFTRASGPHVDHHNFYNDPVAVNTVYALSDGGIYKSTNAGDSWAFIGAGLANVEFYDSGVAASDPILTLGGTQDNGTLKYNGTLTWTEILGGDGATVAIDPNDPKIIYAMNQGADSVQRTSNGASFQGFFNGLPTGPVCNNLPFFIHPAINTTLIAPCLALWRTTSTTPPGSWQQILAQPAPKIITRAVVDPTIDLYYAGTSDGKVLAGPGGTSWRQVFDHPTAAQVADMKVDPADARILMAAFRGNGPNRIYQLTRSSAAPATVAARPIGDGLPSDVVVQSLAIDPSLNFTAYAATNKGVYRGRASSATGAWFWSLYSNGMPLADGRDLEVHPITGVLRLATYGRSAYEVNTVPPVGSVLGAQGRISMIRAHDVGSGYGPPSDRLDVEAVVWLDSSPGSSFGLQLRTSPDKRARHGIFRLLREAFRANRQVHIDYVRTGLRSGRIVRAMLIQ